MKETTFHEMIRSNVIKPGNLRLSGGAVYGQMNEPPGARACCVEGLTLAEQFRDQSGTDVLFFVDNIFRLHRRVLRCLRYWVVSISRGLPANIGDNMGASGTHYIN